MSAFFSLQIYRLIYMVGINRLGYNNYKYQNMSFFGKIFGGEKKEPKTAAGPPKPKEESTEAKKIKI